MNLKTNLLVLGLIQIIFASQEIQGASASRLVGVVRPSVRAIISRRHFSIMPYWQFNKLYPKMNARKEAIIDPQGKLIGVKEYPLTEEEAQIFNRPRNELRQTMEKLEKMKALQAHSIEKGLSSEEINKLGTDIQLAEQKITELGDLADRVGQSLVSTRPVANEAEEEELLAEKAAWEKWQAALAKVDEMEKADAAEEAAEFAAEKQRKEDWKKTPFGIRILLWLTGKLSSKPR